MSEDATEDRATVELDGLTVTDFAGVSNLQPQEMKSELTMGTQLSDKANHDVEMMEHSTETAFFSVNHQLPRSTVHQENTEEDTKTGVNRISAQLHTRNTLRSEWNSKGSVSCQSVLTPGLNERERQTVLDTCDRVIKVRGFEPQTEVPDRYAECAHNEETPCSRTQVLLDGEVNTETKSPHGAGPTVKMSQELRRGDVNVQLARAPGVTEERSPIFFHGEFNSEQFKTKDQTKPSLDLGVTAKVSQERLHDITWEMVQAPPDDITRETARAPPYVEGCDDIEGCERLLDRHMQQYKKLLKAQPRKQTEVR